MNAAGLLVRQQELLREVMRLQGPADSTVSAFFRRHRDLGHRERGTLAETTYEVLRRMPRYRHLAQAGVGPLERRLALLGWQLGGVAPELARRAVAADGPESDWLARMAQVDVASLPAPLRHNLPEWLATPLQHKLGPEGFDALAAAMDAAAPLDLRVNTLKARRDAVLAELQAANVAVAPTPHSPWGLRVQGKPALQRIGAFERGEIEVQDEGSQMLALLTDACRGEMVVDFCAGAGGKTLALGAAMRNTGRLYAFDIAGHRLDALKPRLARSGLSNVYPVQIAHERDDRIKRLAGKIDRVLVDAPCSGLGTLRRNPDLKWRQSLRAVAELQAKQTAILASASRLLKPGGRLVYATCSLLDDENEVVAAGFEAAHAGFQRLDAAALLAESGVPDAAALTDGGALRLWPHRHGTDGFFAVAWQKA